MKSVLFVCLGNICRSPSAEAVMRSLVDESGMDVYIDSAGVTSHHAGEAADARMRRHAESRGYVLTSISRPVVVEDFERFDMIIGMDDSNVAALERMAPNAEARAKISLMTDYCSSFDYDSVPDPYYGGDAGFELVLDLLEDACEGLVKVLY